MDFCQKCGNHVTTLLTHDCSKVTEKFNAVHCSNCGIAHRLSEPCPIVLSRVEFPCPSCATLREELRTADYAIQSGVRWQEVYKSRLAASEARVAMLEKVAEERAKALKFCRNTLVDAQATGSLCERIHNNAGGAILVAEAALAASRKEGG